MLKSVIKFSDSLLITTRSFREIGFDLLCLHIEQARPRERGYKLIRELLANFLGTSIDEHEHKSLVNEPEDNGNIGIVLLLYY